MNYRDAIAYILQRAGYDRGFVANPFDAETVGLQRTEWLLAQLDHPERRYPVVHIAGTNGKGSTAACVAAILQAAGLRVGLYTTPHLHTFRERIQIDGRPIPEEHFAALTGELVPLNRLLAAEHPDWGEATAFELSTVLAFLGFARASMQAAVIEVGLGGRLDATNVVLPEVSVITPVSFDHTHVLGNTLTSIATEKGGIIKPGRPVICGLQPPEALMTLERLAAERGSPFFVAGRDWRVSRPPDGFDLLGPWGGYRNLRLSLIGPYQVENAATAVAACWMLGQGGLPVSEQAIRDGLAAVRWPGRLEVVRERPTIIVDGAHNAGGAEQLAAAIRASFRWRRLTLILGTGHGKDVEGIIRALAPIADHLIVTASRHPRAVPSAWIAAVVSTGIRASTRVDEAETLDAALVLALAEAESDDLICVAGSLYLVAEAREAFGLAEPPEFERELLSR
jgi:dihydrofolate synthase/folylpolyglutamate synthase